MHKFLFLFVVLIMQSASAQYPQLMQDKDGDIGFKNAKGKWLGGSADWLDARPFSEDRAAVKDDMRWGFIDTLGNWVIAAKYKETHDFHSGLAAVHGYGKESNTWFYIDNKGKIRIQYIHGVALEYTCDFVGDFAVVQDLKSNDYLINTKGEVIQPHITAILQYKNNRYLLVYKDIYYVYADANGQFISPICTHKFDLDAAPVRVENIGGKMGTLDADGQLIGAWE